MSKVSAFCNHSSRNHLSIIGVRSSYTTIVRDSWKHISGYSYPVDRTHQTQHCLSNTCSRRCNAIIRLITRLFKVDEVRKWELLHFLLSLIYYNTTALIIYILLILHASSVDPSRNFGIGLRTRVLLMKT